NRWRGWPAPPLDISMKKKGREARPPNVQYVFHTDLPARTLAIRSTCPLLRTNGGRWARNAGSLRAAVMPVRSSRFPHPAHDESRDAVGGDRLGLCRRIVGLVVA